MDLDYMAERALEHFGYENQINKAIEELSELITALAKYQNHSGLMINLTEEIADCTIMIAQLRLLFDASIVDNKIQSKLKRLEDYIQNTVPLKQSGAV